MTTSLPQLPQLPAAKNPTFHTQEAPASYEKADKRPLPRETGLQDTPLENG